MNGRVYFALALLVPLGINWLRAQPLLKPSGLICVVWAAVLFGQEALAPEMIFSEKAGWYILLFVGAFVAGEYIHELFDDTRDELCVTLAARATPANERRLRLWTLAVGCAAVVGSLLYFALFVRHFGGITQTLTAGWEVRLALESDEISAPFFVRGLLLFGYSGVVIALGSWCIFGFRRWQLVPAAAVLIFGIAQLGRAGIIIVVIEFIFFTYYRDMLRGYTKPDRRFVRRIAPIAILISVIFFGGELLRGWDVELDLEADLLHKLGLYALSGPAAFSIFLRTQSPYEPLHWGLYSFDSIASALGLKHQVMGIYVAYVNVSDDKNASDISNIFTSFRNLIDDFGVYGTALFMAGFGYAFSKTFRAVRRGSVAAAAIASTFSAFVVFTIMFPLTIFSSWILSAVFPPILLSMNTRASERPVASETVAPSDLDAQVT